MLADEVQLRPTPGVWLARGLWLVVALAVAVLFTSYRTIPDLFVVIAIIVWFRVPRFRRAWFPGVVLVVFVALELLLPFDVSMLNRPGGPSIRTLQMGMPSPALDARAEADGIELGGCVVRGNEPRWILVW